tara:strand:- start:55 stop:267 length:213 start_codon:yes stop_codon:yes gene_type:complete
MELLKSAIAHRKQRLVMMVVVVLLHLLAYQAYVVLVLVVMETLLGNVVLQILTDVPAEEIESVVQAVVVM